MSSLSQHITRYQPFSGKTIALGICGGIAAYRACDLIRELYRQGAARVICLMTQSAEAFIPALTLEALSAQPVYRYNASVVTQENSSQSGLPVHIQLAQEADLLLVMPATVNTIAKMACGLADDLLTTTFMTFTNKPVLLAPAMNHRMWDHPLFQDNLKRLLALPNVSLVSPVAGLLACGEIGEGHLASQQSILHHAYRLLHPYAQCLEGVKILVTAGGTREPIDPVRCLSNYSSGKMGLALADEAWAMGAEVTLLSSQPELQRPYDIHGFSTIRDLQAVLEAQWPLHDWLLMAAAVSDFRPSQVAAQKMKKYPHPEGEILPSQTLLLEANPDLLASLSLAKQPYQRLVGFAAESEDLLHHAKTKLARKNLDAIVANDISQPGIGFASDENEVTLITASGCLKAIEKAPKPVVARKILHCLHEEFAMGSSVSEQSLIPRNGLGQALTACLRGTGS